MTAAEKTHVIRVEITTGGRAGEVVTTSAESLVFGRDDGVDVRFAEGDRRVSSQHAALRRQGDAWWIRDLGSRNGTWLGATRVEVETRVRSGDEVTLGRNGVRLRLWLPGEAPRDTEFAPELPDPAPPRRPPRTTAIKAYVREALRERNRRTLAWLVFGGVALIAGVSAALWTAFRADAESRAVESRAAAAESAAAEGARLADAPVRLARELGAAVYLLVAGEGEGTKPLCTAFAVNATGALATNAHCVLALIAAEQQGRPLAAIRNRGGAARLPVLAMRTHPDYRPGEARSADLGLVQVDPGAEPITTVIALAPAERLARLSEGEPILLFGFPARTADPAAPVADVMQGRVTKLTGLNGTEAREGDPRSLVWFDVTTTHGTSGAPIVDVDGLLVAVNSGGYFDELETVDTDTGELKNTVVYQPHNYGIRADLLAPLLDLSGEKR